MNIKDKNKINLYFCIEVKTQQTTALRTITETSKLTGIHANTLYRNFKLQSYLFNNNWLIYKDKV